MWSHMLTHTRANPQHIHTVGIKCLIHLLTGDVYAGHKGEIAQVHVASLSRQHKHSGILNTNLSLLHALFKSAV